jgi:transposase
MISWEKEREGMTIREIAKKIVVGQSFTVYGVM